MTSIGKLWLFHEFGVVGDMPLDAVCGAELMKPHASLLKYAPEGTNVFEFGNPTCALCEESFDELLRERSPQLKFMEPVPKF